VDHHTTNICNTRTHAGWEEVLAQRDAEVSNLQAALGELSYESEAAERLRLEVRAATSRVTQLAAQLEEAGRNVQAARAAQREAEEAAEKVWQRDGACAASGGFACWSETLCRAFVVTHATMHSPWLDVNAHSDALCFVLCFAGVTTAAGSKSCARPKYVL
jgi:hypothetical protein